MSTKVLRQALKVANDYGEMICLGGGEPTLHPRFWPFLGIVLGEMLNADDGSIFIVTNGSKTTTALALAKMAASELIGAELSQDDWHDPIDECVVKAFKEAGGYAGIRTVTRILPKGRAVITNVATENPGACACPDLTVDPVGGLWCCGCKEQQFGTVWSPEIPQTYWDMEDERCSSNL